MKGLAATRYAERSRLVGRFSAVAVALCGGDSILNRRNPHRHRLRGATVTFSQAIGVIMGATLGTTSTPWMVALFGFRVSIAAAAKPILGVGAFLWLIAKGRTRSLGAILAGFGLIFIGIEYLQKGMGGISWNLEAFAGTGFGSMWILAGIGVVMTIVMQSSSAAAATTLVALHTGSLTFQQGCAMIVGQSVGSAATTALVAIGGGLAVRRSALALIIFSVTVGVLGMLFLAPLTAAADWVGAQLNVRRRAGVTDSAASSSSAGIAVFYPGSIASPSSSFGSPDEQRIGRQPSRPDPRGRGEVALEVAWRAIPGGRAWCGRCDPRRLAGDRHMTPVVQHRALPRIVPMVHRSVHDGPRLVPRPALIISGRETDRHPTRRQRLQLRLSRRAPGACWAA